ncbi:hypothetical protein HZ326_6861 [Fusarium oxysporum f. sp. albedinis]|nr:hypothetical protein HZ326_6861 [Fusarium oxysporum f. sp. albedinis]
MTDRHFWPFALAWSHQKPVKTEDVQGHGFSRQGLHVSADSAQRKLRRDAVFSARPHRWLTASCNDRFFADKDAVFGCPKCQKHASKWSSRRSRTPVEANMGYTVGASTSKGIQTYCPPLYINFNLTPPPIASYELETLALHLIRSAGSVGAILACVIHSQL